MTRTSRRLGVCLLAFALVTAGCQAPVASGGESPGATPEPTATPTGPDSRSSGGPGGELDVPNVTVVNGSLDADPGRVFARVQSLLGTDVPPPERVRVVELSEFRNRTANASRRVPRFWRLAGLSTESANRSEFDLQKNGYVSAVGEIGIVLGANTTAVDERLILAHEFVHYVQVQNDRSRQLSDAIGATTSEDAYLLRALKEGAAVYTTDAYMREFVSGDRLNSPWYDRIAASYPPGHVGRYANSRYVVGHEYVAARVDSPANLSRVYENPPRTAEQLVHGAAPGTEPPTPLNVTVRTGGDWLTSGSDRMGEAFLRYALASAVGPERAARAAAGWGNDRVRIVRSTAGGVGYAWVLDWDDAADATEFERTFRAALAARGEPNGSRWRLPAVGASATVVEVSGETTAILLGSRSFVAGASVAGGTGQVTVTVGDPRPTGA